MKFLIAILIAAVSLVTYWCNTEKNEFTGEKQRVSMTVDQEIALGLQAAPEMASQYGGIHPDNEAAASVKAIGKSIRMECQQVMRAIINLPYYFKFSAPDLYKKSIA